jgi:hypothetical protein
MSACNSIHKVEILSFKTEQDAHMLTNSVSLRTECLGFYLITFAEHV